MTEIWKELPNFQRDSWKLKFTQAEPHASATYLSIYYYEAVTLNACKHKSIIIINNLWLYRVEPRTECSFHLFPISAPTTRQENGRREVSAAHDRGRTRVAFNSKHKRTPNHVFQQPPNLKRIRYSIQWKWQFVLFSTVVFVLFFFFSDV